MHKNYYEVSEEKLARENKHNTDFIKSVRNISPKHSVKVQIGEKLFDSIALAAKHYHCSPSTIKNRKKNGELIDGHEIKLIRPKKSYVNKLK